MIYFFTAVWPHSEFCSLNKKCAKMFSCPICIVTVLEAELDKSSVRFEPFPSLQLQC